MPTVTARRGMTLMSPPTVTELIVRVSRARLSTRVGNAANSFDGHRFARLRRLIESQVPVDADAAEARIDATAGSNQPRDGGDIARIRKHAVFRPRGQSPDRADRRTSDS